MKNIAILSFLLSLFLVACGDDSSSSADDLNEESELSSSSSSKANKSSNSSSSSSVKNKSSSSSSEKSEKNTENPPKLINKTISGMAQGPFEEGSTVSVYELDTNFQKTGYNIETEIINEHGEYSINVKNFQSQYALLKVDGNLRDIFTENKTANKTTFYALVDLDNAKKANINILTHLAHKRALYLITKKNMTVAKAQKQAETEVLKSFNIKEDLGAAEEIDFFAGNKQSSILLSISALMQVSAKNVKNLLAEYISDIEKDGTWDDKKTIAKIADWAFKQQLGDIWNNVNGYIPVEISVFKKYVNNFWLQNYGLENCTKNQKNKITKITNSASNNANSFIICKSPNWIIANEDEVMKYLYTDTLHIDSTANDGEFYWDKKYSVCYVYEDSVWIKINKTNCTLGLSECTKLRKNNAEQDSNNQWYICDGKEWISMDDYESIKEKGLLFEKDIQNWKDTTEGAIRKGNITDIIYIFNNQKWRIATLPEASLGGCNEKTVGNFGYAEKRQGQDMIEPRGYECVVQTHSDECPSPNYGSGYYICEKSYENKFYWETIDYRGYNSICNNRSDDTNSQKVNTYWGNFAPAKKKCVNCKQENIDHFEDQCKKRCYASGYIAHASACALGFGGCTKDLYGTIKEGPSIKVGAEYIYERYENYYQLSYLISIDSTKKTTYICRNRYSWEEPTYPAYQWYAASDFDIDAAPTICTWDLENLGLIVVGKKNKYVCEDESFRLATQEEIEEGFACTEPMYYREKCDSGLEKQTGMTCTEYMRHVEKCRTK